VLAVASSLGLGALSGCKLPSRGAVPTDDEDLPFRVSLAQWSLHRTLRGGELDALDFPRHAKERFGIDAVEYVNQFFGDKAGDFAWLERLRAGADDAGVRSLLIMIDGEGSLGDPDDVRRRAAIGNHFKWIAAAGFLGCHAIRVNVDGSGDPDRWRDRAADSLRRLADQGSHYGISVIVENHGKLSSDGAWLASVMEAADHPGVGTLPDFGNFRIAEGNWYDRYLGVEQLMPFAKAVSAKSHDFDEAGNETHTDYRRMLQIVMAAGYGGYIGIEYEGGGLSEAEGIDATHALLKRVRAELMAR
jgi:sugar phosphate isomerase/epimerase